MKGKDVNEKVKERLKTDQKFRGDWNPYEGLKNKEYPLDYKKLRITVRRNPACDGWLYNEDKGILVLLEIEVKGSATFNSGKILNYVVRGGPFKELPYFKDNGPKKVIVIHIANKKLSSYDRSIAEMLSEKVEKEAKDKGIALKYYFNYDIEFPEDVDECATKIVNKIYSILPGGES